MNWSPEQIAGWLKAEYPRDERYHVSHETIYHSFKPAVRLRKS
jgi:IS30 family transposase